MTDVSEKKKALLVKLESLVGNECYNASIKNWGPHGSRFHDGREYRYAVTFVDQDGNKTKTKNPDKSLSADIFMTGSYVFGANQLMIMRALDKVITYLEDNHGLKI
jgi:hypothetical protein